PLSGVWRGQGHQSPAGSEGADWSIVMTIRDGDGSIEYPSLRRAATITASLPLVWKADSGRGDPCGRPLVAPVYAPACQGRPQGSPLLLIPRDERLDAGDEDFVGHDARRRQHLGAA